MAGLFLSGAAALTAGVLKWGSRKAELEAYSLAASGYPKRNGHPLSVGGGV